MELKPKHEARPLKGERPKEEEGGRGSGGGREMERKWGGNHLRTS